MLFFFNNKVKVADSGLFDGFVDMHCHVLPAVDDGVQTQKESLEILQCLEGLGVKEMWFTSHLMDEVPNTPEGLREHFDAFLPAYKGKIKLHLAAEHMLDGLFVKRIGEKRVLPHADDMLLVETSYSNPPLGMDDLLEQVKSAGFRPLLAHPERYRYMGRDDYKALKDNGIRFQLNIPSLVGGYGVEPKRRAEKLLEEGMYECFGTDLHSIRQLRGFMECKIRRKDVRLIQQIQQNQF